MRAPSDKALMPGAVEPTSAAAMHALLQLGRRLKYLRIQAGLNAAELATRAGLSRTTLRAIETGEPSSTMESYLRVMGALGVSKDLALIASGTMDMPGSRKQGTGANAASATVTHRGHELQDLQSLVLHREAVRLMKKDPALIQQALDTLSRWRSRGRSRSDTLLDEWANILHRRNWRRALANSERSRELRQASPLSTVVPESSRIRILEEVKRLKDAR